ncbi:efflux RND transporter permease subunit [Roseovarius sp. MBR-6]|jgi:multidrug efflux pump subunit AcrB|uniref:efflux RND transporter permease subunit n=1 Tax=Roseovarius sp. MBR-6 TaxID=3156459 RepID=UPI00339B7A8D
MIGPNLSEWALKNRQLTVYMMIVAVIAGAFAFFNLGRDEDPPFTIKTMLVTAVWPGATIEETQSQLTDRLERRLEETTGLDSLRSITRPGLTTVFVDLTNDFPPDRVPEVWQEVRNGIGDIRHTLPEGALGPFFNDEFGDVFGIIYAFTADGFSERDLRDHVDSVRTGLLRQVDGIKKIEWIGVQDERIMLEFLPDRVAAMGLDYSQIFGAIAAQNVVRPAGVVTTGEENVAIRVSGSFETEADLLEVSLVANGRMLRLGDIATVRRTLVDPPQPMLRVNGKPAIALAISMAEGGDILELGAQVTRAMERIVVDLPLGIDAIMVSNQAEVVDQAIGEFTTSLVQAVLIILAVSFVSLGARPGAVVAIAIPLTLAIVFVVMQAFSIDLHRISLGALIIALGLLVDDAMTTIDAMLRRLAAGDTIEKAATFAYGTLAAPMMIGTLITIAGFVPVGFAQSSAGEYTISLFYVVGIALIASWFVAVLFAPLIGAILLKPPAGSQEEAKPGAIMRTYVTVVGVAIRARWVTLAITAALLATAFVGLGRVDRQFFPASDRGELIVDLQLPRSSSIFASEAAAKQIEAFIEATGDAESITSYVGRNVIRFYLPLDIQPPSDNQAQIVVMSKDLEARARLEVSLKVWLTETFPEAISRISPLELGPPVGWPIQYRVSGPDLEAVRVRAMELAGVIAADPDTRDVHFDWIEPARQIRIEVDQDRVRRLGMTSAQVASVLNTAVTGTPVSQLRDDIYLIPIVARADERDRVSIDRLATLQVPAPGGRTVALGQFAIFSYDQEQPLLWRRDRLPTLTVLADTAPGVSPEAVVERLGGEIAAFDAQLAPGYEVIVAGTVAESAESQASVFAVIPVMIFLMVTLLMIQLRDFRDMGLVMILLPLGLIGVVAALLLFGRPLGFVAILGILALNGMIAKNAVILLTQISEERAQGTPVREAVVRAASNRFRPLLLTALSTVLGLMPIAPTLFWGPMAFATMGGLLVATLLTLVFLPTVYTMLHRDAVAGRAPDDA